MRPAAMRSINQVDDYALAMVSGGSSEFMGYNLGKDGCLVNQVDN